MLEVKPIRNARKIAYFLFFIFTYNFCFNATILDFTLPNTILKLLFYSVLSPTYQNAVLLSIPK